MKNNLLAQKIKIGSQEIEGPLTYLTGGSGSSINSIGDLVNRLVDFIIPLSGIILLLVLIWGGYDYLLSHGDPEKVKSGKGKITAGIIGFIIIILAYTLTKLIAYIFGLQGFGF